PLTQRLAQRAVGSVVAGVRAVKSDLSGDLTALYEQLAAQDRASAGTANTARSTRRQSVERTCRLPGGIAVLSAGLDRLILARPRGGRWQPVAESLFTQMRRRSASERRVARMAGSASVRVPSGSPARTKTLQTRRIERTVANGCEHRAHLPCRRSWRAVRWCQSRPFDRPVDVVHAVAGRVASPLVVCEPVEVASYRGCRGVRAVGERGATAVGRGGS